MGSVGFFTSLQDRWNMSPPTDRTSAKLVLSATITAVVITIIAVTLYFTLHNYPLAGWTIGSLLMVTALPGGLVAVAAQLVLAFLSRCCLAYAQKLEQEQREDIQRQLQDPNSPIMKNINKFSEELKKSLDKIEIKEEDLISVLKKLEKDNNTLPLSDEEKELCLLSFPILHPLTAAEIKLCEAFGIDHKKCRLANQS